MALNDRAIKTAKPKDKAFKLSDRDGLYLLVNPGGSKLWRVDYTYAGKRRTLALGRYPQTSLADARLARIVVREQLDAGHDPVIRRKEEKRQQEMSNRTTFEAIAEEYLQRLTDSGNKAETVEQYRRKLKAHAYPSIGRQPIAEIKPAQLFEVLQRIEQRGFRNLAHSLRTLVGSVFRYAIMTLRAETDPTSALRGALMPHATKPMAALTEPREIGNLLNVIDSYEGWQPRRFGLLFAAHTFVRPSEVRFAHWSEIDLEEACWSIPAERMKMKRPHLVPLSPQAAVILNKVRRITGSKEWVFPSATRMDKPLVKTDFSKTLKDIGFGDGRMTTHGFRAMASTVLNERGFRPDVIEMQLAHVEGNKVRRAYNRAQYWPERVEMMNKWADMLDEFRRLQ